jgi:hypothetical protein
VDQQTTAAEGQETEEGTGGTGSELLSDSKVTSEANRYMGLSAQELAQQVRCHIVF